MFKLIGALVVYGFAAFGVTRFLEQHQVLENLGQEGVKQTSSPRTFTVVK